MSAADSGYEGWDPMKEDYVNPEFNSYDRGPGRDIPLAQNTAVKYAMKNYSTMPVADSNECVSLYVTGLPKDLTNEGLANLFMNCGTVLRTNVLQAKPDREDTVGFVNMKTLSGAERAIAQKNGFPIGGRFRLRVQMSLSKEEKRRRAEEKMNQEEFFKSLGNSRGDAPPALEVNSVDSDVEVMSVTSVGSRNRNFSNNLPASDMSPQRPRSPTRDDEPSTSPVERTRNNSGDTIISLPALEDNGQSYTSYRGRGRGRGRFSWRGGYQSRMGMMQRLPYPPMYPPMMPYYGYYPVYPPPPPHLPYYSGYPGYGMGQSDGGYKSHQYPSYPHPRSTSPSSVHSESSSHAKYSPKKPVKHCVSCGKPDSAFHCKVCKVPYCGRDCQANDWPKHKEKCKQIQASKTLEGAAHSNRETVNSSVKSPLMQSPRESEPVAPDTKLRMVRNDQSPVNSLKSPDKDQKKKKSSNKTGSPPTKGGLFTVEDVPSPLGKGGPSPAKGGTSPAKRGPSTAKGDLSPSKTEFRSPSSQNSRSPNQKPDKQQKSKQQVERSHQPSAPVSPVMASHLDKLMLPSEGTCDVIVTDFDDPQAFWIQIVTQENISEVTKLTEELNKAYNESQPTSHRPVIGELCAARYSQDHSWYRARVDSVMPDGRLSVLFVDYGNKDVVPVGDTRTIDTRFTSLKTMAIRCSLDGVKVPPGGQWPKDFLHECQNLLMCGETFVATLIGDRVGKVAVCLQCQDGYDVREKLKLLDTRVEDAPPSSLLTTACESVRSLKFFTDLVREDDTFEGLVTVIESLDSFWVQVPYKTDEFQSMVQTLNEVYGGLHENKTYRPNPNDAVCAKFSVDNQWYRGHVLQVKGDTVDVLYLDYGNKESVLFKDIHPLDQRFREDPTRAVHCFLPRVTEPVSTDALAYFASRVNERMIKVKVVEQRQLDTRSQLGVMVLLDNDVSLLEEMVSKKLLKLDCAACERNIKIDSLARSSLKVGQVTNVMITHVNSPADFYVVKMDSDFLVMVRGLLEDFAQSKAQSRPAVLEVGDVISTSYMGDLCRASILEVGADSCKVNFIDYGNADFVKLEDVFVLDSKYEEYPAFAVRCSLDGVDNASNEFQEYFKQLENSQVLVSAGAVDGGACVHYVNMKLLDERGTVVNDLGRPNELSPPAATKTESLSKPAQVFMLSDMHLIELNSKQAKVIVTDTVSPMEFHCQLADPDLIGQLDQLMEAISEKCHEDSPLDSVVSGQMVTCLMIDDNSFYRAVVETTNPSGDTCVVRYVDYGNREEVPISRTRQVYPGYMSMPVLAFKCQLAGYVAVGEPWNLAQQSTFSTIMTGKVLDAEFVKVVGDTHVIKLSQENGKVIGDLLVAAGLTAPTEQQVAPKEQHVTPKPSLPVQSATSPTTAGAASVDEVAALKDQVQQLTAMMSQLLQASAAKNT